MAKKPVLIFSKWQTPESTESGKFELTAALNGREWIERASLKLTGEWDALERVMHEAVCTAINWSDEFKVASEAARMKQYLLPDILDFFECYQTEGFKSRTRRFKYSHLIDLVVIKKEPVVIPHTVQEEAKLEEGRNVILDTVKFISDYDNCWDPDKQCSKSMVGKAWGLECDLRIQFTLGNAFIKGYMGDMPFVMFYRYGQDVCVHTYKFGEEPDLKGTPAYFVKDTNSVEILSWFKSQAGRQKG